MAEYTIPEYTTSTAHKVWCGVNQGCLAARVAEDDTIAALEPRTVYMRGWAGGSAERITKTGV